MNAAAIALSLLALPALAWCGWWTLLGLVALRRPRAIRDGARALRFAVIVPAHNEEDSIERCLQSLAATHYEPAPELIVVADNCTDATADRARRLGATVLERADSERRGKGYALDFALRQIAAGERHPDAVAFVDADSTVSPAFFPALAERLDGGAAAVQAHYAAGEGAAPLTRLRRLAFLLIHWSRPLGATRLGLGTGIKGNGMALRWAVARDGLGATGITEDAELTLGLARRGVAVAFAPHAEVRGFMASEYGAARTQDRRWERGRFALLLPALATTVHALARRRVACAAAALEVASPPLSLLAMLAAGATLGALLQPDALPIALAASMSILIYVTVGLVAARAPIGDVLALYAAPRFIVHKAAVLASNVFSRAEAQWQRTERR